MQRDSLCHPRSCRGLPPPQRQHYCPPRPRIRVCFRERRGLIAYLASYTPSCSLVFSRVCGCFPPHPTTCCVTITHLSVSRQRPTASNAASHHRGAASPTRKPRLTVTRDDQVSGHHLNPHPRTLNKPTPAPQKSSTSRQPRRRPLGAATPLNTQKSSTSDHLDDLDDNQHTRPHPRTPSNTQMSRTIDTNDDPHHDPVSGQQLSPRHRTRT